MDILYLKTEQHMLEFKKNSYSDEVILNITELFREMRNVCSMMYSNLDYQCGIVYFADGAILQNVIDIVSNILPLLNSQNEYLEKCFAIGMQLIGNLVVGNTKNQEIILMKYSSFFKNMFVYEGAKNYIYMIYYNCYLGSPHLEQLIISHNEAMTELTNVNLNSEFAELFIELFLDRCQYFENFFENIPAQERPCLLHMIRERYLANRDRKYSTSFVAFLPNKFKNYNHETLLQSFKSSKQTTAKEAAAVLDLLSNFSSNENYLKTYQQDITLFQYTVDIFLTIHFLDVKSNSGFSDIFSKTGSNGFKLGPSSFFENVQKNPTYIFKVNLVRLISNLAWRNPNLDNKQVERKNLIPALLDCCCIDAANPFVFEWSVFAIHNLRENHINNQRQIEMLRRQGAISKQMMKQMNKNMTTSGDPELLTNLSLSSDSSSGNDATKKNTARRKCRKTRKEYHKYSSSSSSSSSTFHSDNNSDKNEEKETEKKEPAKSPVPGTSKEGVNECEPEEDLPNMLSSTSISGPSHQNADTENTYLYENFDKNKQQKRFTERF